MRINVTAFWYLLSASVLSVSTTYAIRALAPARVGDWLAIPGAIVAMPGGVLGLYDVPSGAWALVCIAGNFVTYAVFWWLIVRLAVRLLGEAHE